VGKAKDDRTDIGLSPWVGWTVETGTVLKPRTAGLLPPGRDSRTKVAFVTIWRRRGRTIVVLGDRTGLVIGERL
jgi:hypothetical protein